MDEVTKADSQDQDMSQRSEKPAEKMIPESRVNQILHERTKNVEAKTRQEVLAELEAKRAHEAPMVSAQSQSQSSMGGMSQMSPEQIAQMVSKHVSEGLEGERKRIALQHQEELGRRMVSEFTQKIHNSTKYPDLATRLINMGVDKMPHIVELANGFDNTDDIMDELERNIGKIGNIHSAYMMNPQLGRIEMQRLSQSIKENGKAANHKPAKEPLDHLQSSATATDKGSLTPQDYREVDWLRV